MKSDKSKNGRRDFLKGAAITAAAATVAAFLIPFPLHIPIYLLFILIPMMFLLYLPFLLVILLPYSACCSIS